MQHLPNFQSDMICQKDHRNQHMRGCKKRAAELRDESLFMQPESSYLGDCPICCLPLSLDKTKSCIMTCCSKVICKGCAYANKLREWEMMLEQACPFCREPLSKTDEEHDKQTMKRIEANDPLAIRHEGGIQYEKGEYIKAVELWTKAAKLGDARRMVSWQLCIEMDKSLRKTRGS